MEETQDVQAASSTATQDIAEPTGTAGEGAASQGQQDVPFSEHPRWKEVYGELKGFKALGVTPEQIMELGQEVLSYREQAKAAKETAAHPQTEEERDAEETSKAQRAELERIFPELKDLGRLKQMVKTLEDQAAQNRDAVDRQALTTLTSLITQAGLQASKEKVNSLAKRVSPIIQDDPALLQLYYRDPSAAVTKAWDMYCEDLDTITSRRTGAKLQQKGAALQSLPRGGQGGGVGATGTSASPPPKNIDELFRQNRGLLSGKE